MSDFLLYDSQWLESNKNKRDYWVQEVLDDYEVTGQTYLACLLGWYNEFPGTRKQKSTLLASLKSSDNSAHLGAVNEIFWWKTSFS